MAMQAFGTPYGPLVAPAIPEGTDVATPFMNAFQVAAQNNAKQRSLENQMQRYALQAQQTYNERLLDWAKFGQAQTRLENDRDQKQRMYELAVGNANNKDKLYELRDENLQFRINKEFEQGDAKANADRAVNEVEIGGILPGDPKYPSQAHMAIQPYIAKMPTQAYDHTVDSIAARHNVAAANKWKAYNMQKQMYEQDVGGTLGYDVNLRPNTAAVYNPQSLLTPKKTGGFFGYGAKPLKDEKGDPIYEVTLKDATGATHPATITMTQINDLRKRDKDIEAMHDQLPGMMVGPTTKPPADLANVNVDPQAAILHQRARQALADPNASSDARAAAQKYLQDNPY
jgi:hypothetical protein